MATEIFRLMGSIFIDNDKANKALDQTDKKGQGVAGTLKNGIATAAKFGSAMVGAAGLAGGAIIKLASNVGNAADRLLDLSAITGMSTDEIQRWERVTKVAGVNADAMTNASQRLTKSLDAMSSPTSKGNRALQELGFTLDEIKNMDADTRMDALVKALSEIEDPTERARIGTDLFAGSWKELAPIVDMGAEAMDRAKASANIISKEDLERANEFRIRMALMRDQAGHFAMMLGVKLLPIAEKLFDWVSEYMPQIEKAVSQAFNVIGAAVGFVAEHIFPMFADVVRTVIDTVATIWERWGDTITTVVVAAFTVIKTVVETALNVVMGIISVFVGVLTGDFENIKEGLTQIWDALWGLIGQIVGAARDFVLEIVTNLKDRLLALGEHIQVRLSDLWNRIYAQVRETWGGIRGFIFSIADQIRGTFDNLVRSAWNWGRNLISNFVSGIQAMWDSLIHTLSGVGSLVSGFLGFRSPTKFGPGRDADKWAPNLIKMFAEGLEKHSHLLMSALQNTAQVINPTFNPTFNPVLAVPAAGGPVVIQNLNVYGGWDEIKRELDALGVVIP